MNGSEFFGIQASFASINFFAQTHEFLSNIHDFFRKNPRISAFFARIQVFSARTQELLFFFARMNSKNFPRTEEFMRSSQESKFSQESKNFYVLRKSPNFCRISVEPFVRSSCRTFRPSFCFIYRIYHFSPNAFAEAQFKVEIFMTYSLGTS